MPRAITSLDPDIEADAETDESPVPPDESIASNSRWRKDSFTTFDSRRCRSHERACVVGFFDQHVQCRQIRVPFDERRNTAESLHRVLEHSPHLRPDTTA